MQFEIRNIWTKCVGTLAEEEQVATFLSIQDPNRFYSKLYQNYRAHMKLPPELREHHKIRMWDGWHRFYDRRRHGFPTGLLNYVLGRCEKNDITPTLVDLRTRPEPRGTDLSSLDFIPRDYQLELTELSIKVGRGIIQAATNAGKTEIASMIIKKLGLPTLYIVHTNELLMQTKKRFERHGIASVGVIGAGIYEFGVVNVAMIQTLSRYQDTPEIQDLLSRSQVIFVDECHHTASESYYKLMLASQAYYRYGLSGTPFHKDIYSDMRLLAVTGSVIPIKVDNAFLIKEGYSAVPYIILVDTPINPVVKRLKTYAGVYSTYIKENLGRNRLISQVAEKLVSQGRQTIVIIKQIDHGQRLLDIMRSQGSFISEFVHGGCDYEFRQDVLQRFKDKQIDVLISSTILDEGVDVPEIHAVILAVGEKSPIKLLQRIGRGLRKKENNYLTIVDFNDKDHEYSIRHRDERLLVYRQQGFPIYQGISHLDNLSELERNLPLSSDDK